MLIVISDEIVLVVFTYLTISAIKKLRVVAVVTLPASYIAMKSL